LILQLQGKNLSHKLASFFSSGFFPAALGMFFLPFIWLMFYASLSTDDFVKAALSYDCTSQPAVRSVTGMAWVMYTQGSGRWLTSFLQSLAMNKFDLVSYYGWLLLLVMVSNLIGLAYFLAKFLRLPYTRAFLGSGMFIAVWLASTSDPKEGVYWLTASTEYQLPITTLLILAGLLCKSKHSVTSYTALSILAIAIPAQHELAGVFLVASLFVAAVAARILRRPGPQWWLCLTLALISLATNVFSPGKSLWLERGNKTAWNLTNFLPFAKRAGGYGIDWAINPVVLLCVFCMILLLRPRKSETEECGYLPPRWLGLACFAAMGFLLFQFAVMEKASGYVAFGSRVIGWTQFMFWLLMVLGILVGVPELSRIRFSKRSQVGILALFLVCLFGSGEFRLAVRDLRGPARPWWKANNARLRQTGSSLQFEPLPPKPVLFNDTSLAKDPECWVNRCMAIYLGVEKVAVNGTNENAWINGCDLKR
jgi:hypothetical protein